MSLRLEGAELKGRIRVDAFAVERGECVVVCGPNGSGKSSLLRLLAGLMPPDQGKLWLDGALGTSLSATKRAEIVAWLPQHAAPIEPIPALQLIASARYRFSEPEALTRQAAERALAELDLLPLKDRLSSAMSGGELQRVLIASLVAQDAPLLLVDEPANHLDPKHQVETYKKLGELWQRGRGLVIVSHDVRLAQLLGPPERIRVVGVGEGTLKWECSFSDPQLSAHLSSLYQVPFISPDAEGALAVDLKKL